ncbi:hypothetical protein DNC80_08835 [Flavobacterium sp. SOK18b]|uniref:DUF7829 domain-containing protein n=1 Tax=Flavobacterium sp. SOK18b TaxID=797900 RepID=UPI0015F9F294|nr:DUF6035 family protein [Flavobacterium sp. SOK18b]MBB1193770.1 hypothetical protein [Flavobacterium sp. SOK18b]
MDYWKKQGIDNFIIELEKYYLDCSAEYFAGQGIVDKLNKEETKYLNDSLDLSKMIGIDSKYILNEILKNKEKDKFSYFLLRSTNINLEVNCIDEAGKTVFILLAENYFFEKSSFLIYSINQLFERNYSVKKEDEIFVAELYKKIQSQSQLESWSILRFAVKLNNKEKFALACQKHRELFVILSLKMNKPISFNFPNLLGVINNAIQFYRESGEVILKAMRYYERTRQIMELDSRKGTFKKKLAEFETNKPIQNKEFEEIVINLFPELK